MEREREKLEIFSQSHLDKLVVPILSRTVVGHSMDLVSNLRANRTFLSSSLSLSAAEVVNSDNSRAQSDNINEKIGCQVIVAITANWRVHLLSKCGS